MNDIAPTTRLQHPGLGLDPNWEVPAFEARVLSDAPRSRYCIVIPVINEGEKLLNQLRGMSGGNLGCDIIVADGGSKDGSTDDEGLRSLGVHSVLVKKGPGKLSAQLRMGFAWALHQGYEGVIAIDGNGKDGWQAIPSFVAALDRGTGFVQGSRYVEGGVAVNTPLDRHLAVKLLHAPLISLSAGQRYTDTTNGFRAFSADFLRDPRVAPFRDIFSTYNLHYYLAIRAARLGYPIEELPVTRSYPAAGKTPTKISGLRGRLHILRQMAEACLHRYDPPAGGKA